MNTRSKVVEVKGTKYELRRLPPEAGSFILLQMMGAQLRGAQAQADKPAKPNTPEPEVTEVQPQISGEQRVRILFFAVASGSLKFEEFRFIQDACMKVCSRLEQRAEREFPMPLMTDIGGWTPAGEDVSTDVGTVLKLTNEVLVFCFSDFFEEGALPGA